MALGEGEAGRTLHLGTEAPYRVLGWEVLQKLTYHKAKAQVGMSVLRQIWIHTTQDNSAVYPWCHFACSTILFNSHDTLVKGNAITSIVQRLRDHLGP